MDNLGVTFKNKNERAEFMADRLNNHAKIQKEINTTDVIDYKAFKKTKEEKAELKNIIKIWKRKRHV